MFDRGAPKEEHFSTGGTPPPGDPAPDLKMGSKVTLTPQRGHPHGQIGMAVATDDSTESCSKPDSE